MHMGFLMQWYVFRCCIEVFFVVVCMRGGNLVGECGGVGEGGGCLFMQASLMHEVSVFTMFLEFVLGNLPFGGGHKCIL